MACNKLVSDTARPNSNLGNDCTWRSATLDLKVKRETLKFKLLDIDLI